MAIPTLRATTAALLLFSAAACEELTVPQLGGAYFNVEGAVLFELPLEGLQSITAPNRVLIAQPVDSMLRVLIINRGDRTFGAPLSFVMQLDDGVAPRGGNVLAVSAPNDEIRDFVGGYVLRFSRDRTGDIVSDVIPPATSPPGPYTVAQLIPHFFGVPASAAVIADLDWHGNFSGAYDIGDLRRYLLTYPSQMPTTDTWTR
jgi:hypothetical protein